ncbi:fructokinase [Clostridia bacterium]|nr:fructokinase [Clostridia bacterium]
MKAVCMGVLIMDMFPDQYGVSLTQVRSWLPMPGGAPANVAVALAKFGTQTAFLGQVGEDAFGHMLADCLAGWGVRVHGIRFDAQRRTTMNFHAKPNPTETEYLFYRNPGADTGYHITEADIAVLKQADVLHFDSMSMTDTPMRDSAIAAMVAAREANVWVSFDYNYREPVWPNANASIEAMRAVLPYCDSLKVNAEEAAMLCPGVASSVMPDMLLAQGPRVVLITRGEEGSSIAAGSQSATIQPMSVQTVDAIGCGDAYAAGFLYALFERFTKEQLAATRFTGSDWVRLVECARFASVVSGLTAQKKGALQALPTADEVDAAWSTISEQDPQWT